MKYLWTTEERYLMEYPFRSMFHEWFWLIRTVEVAENLTLTLELGGLVVSGTLEPAKMTVLQLKDCCRRHDEKLMLEKGCT